MEWTALLKEIFEICIIPLLGVLVGFLIKIIKNKSDEIIMNCDSEILKKYARLASQTIISCVAATNQTYVDALKEQGAFDAEAQKEAFNRTLSAVLSILSGEASVYLENAYGDLQTYLKERIEAEVRIQKDGKGNEIFLD